jgi:uncharacterized protein
MIEPDPSMPARGTTTPTARRRNAGLARMLLTVPARLVSGLIWIYQRTLSPALVVINPTCGCRFAPTCSHYAREALQTHGLVAGLGLTVVRLAKCGPWHPGGEDPVPSRGRPVCTSVRR